MRGGIEAFQKNDSRAAGLVGTAGDSSDQQRGRTELRVVASRARMEIQSLILLDRPVRKEMLLSAIQVAHNSRQKQLQVRDAAARQSQSDEALRKSEQLAVAGRMMATMAHEVNNPLEALGNLLYLVENSSSPRGSAVFRSTRHEGTSADQRDRGSHAALPPRTRQAGLHRCLGTGNVGVNAFRGKLRERHIRERIKVERAFGYCCEGEIRQALVNLIGNAVDAMREAETCGSMFCQFRSTEWSMRD